MGEKLFVCLGRQISKCAPASNTAKGSSSNDVMANSDNRHKKKSKKKRE